MIIVTNAWIYSHVKGNVLSEIDNNKARKSLRFSTQRKKYSVQVQNCPVSNLVYKRGVAEIYSWKKNRVEGKLAEMPCLVCQVCEEEIKHLVACCYRKLINELCDPEVEYFPILPQTFLHQSGVTVKPHAYSNIVYCLSQMCREAALIHRDTDSIRCCGIWQQDVNRRSLKSCKLQKFQTIFYRIDQQFVVLQ